MILKICLQCNKKFISPHIYRKLCSKPCSDLYKTGRSLKITVENFWNKIDKNGPLILDTPCWVWLGKPGKNGYGSISDKGKRIYVHRYSWILHFGVIDNLHVCHKCDNRICVNPAHLFLGTDADNIRDAMTKNRLKKPPLIRGESQHLSKLTKEAVIEIRQSYPNVTLQNLANKYGVSKNAIHNVVHRKTWKHIANTIDNSADSGTIEDMPTITVSSCCGTPVEWKEEQKGESVVFTPYCLTCQQTCNGVVK